MNPILSVVVPAYNEEEVLLSAYERLSGVLDALGEEYEIICAVQGQEALVSQAMQRMKEGCSRRIVLVDTPEQISALDFPSIAGYCTVDKSGTVRYYQLRKG